MPRSTLAFTVSASMILSNSAKYWYIGRKKRKPRPLVRSRLFEMRCGTRLRAQISTAVRGLSINMDKMWPMWPRPRTRPCFVSSHFGLFLLLDVNMVQVLSTWARPRPARRRLALGAVAAVPGAVAGASGGGVIHNRQSYRNSDDSHTRTKFKVCGGRASAGRWRRSAGASEARPGTRPRARQRHGRASHAPRSGTAAPPLRCIAGQGAGGGACPWRRRGAGRRAHGRGGAKR